MAVGEAIWAGGLSRTGGSKREVAGLLQGLLSEGFCCPTSLGGSFKGRGNSLLLPLCAQGSRPSDGAGIWS